MAQSHSLGRQIENSKLKIENSKLKIENSKLKIENSKLKIENSKLKIENLKLKIENSKLKIENSKLKIENSKLKIENLSDRLKRNYRSDRGLSKGAGPAPLLRRRHTMLGIVVNRHGHAIDGQGRGSRKLILVNSLQGLLIEQVIAGAGHPFGRSI